MSRVGWNALASWRDQRMGDRGDLWHRALIDPTMLKLLGSVRGCRVLDVGCGNGYLTRRLKRWGAARAVGVDSALASIRLARRREAARPSGAEFVHGDATRLAQFDSQYFNRIVANMSLMDVRNADATIREIGRLLAPDGRFVFSINHPCFDIDETSAWLVERRPYHESIARKVEGYRRERWVRVPWKISDAETAYTRSYHRTLATYSRYLNDAGLAILRIEEPAPRPELIRKSPQGRFISEIPLHIVFEAAHWPGRPRLRSRSRRRTRGAGPRAAPHPLRG